MVSVKEMTRTHPTDNDLADFLAKSMSGAKMARIAEHISSCDDCLAATVAAHESVGSSHGGTSLKDGIWGILKKFNPYLLLAVISFTLSFLTPRYFIQLLVATLLLGIKWVVDSKSARMLVMIYEAWKSGGEKEASRILQRMGGRDGSIT